MRLRDAISSFERTHSPVILAAILEEHGRRGFALACRAAGIPRGVGKRMIGIYDDSFNVKKLARREAGLHISRLAWR